MGALTSNRKRTDVCFSLFSPSPSFNSSNYYQYSNIIDSQILKRPRISYPVQSPEKVNSSPQNIVSRLHRYPEPTRQLQREVHAPSRVAKFGFLSNLSSGLKSGASGIRENAERMGNILRKKYEEAKERAFRTIHHVKIGKEVIDVEYEPEKEDVVSEDSSDVEILEDGHEVRSLFTDDHRVQQPNGLAIENRKSDEKPFGNDFIQPSSAVSDVVKDEHAGKMLDSLSFDRDVYVDGVPLHKKLLGTVERSYSNKLVNLRFEIDSVEAQLQSLRLLQSLKKPGEEVSFHQPFVPLTEEEKKEVASAFSYSNRGNKLVTHENSNIEITGNILQCLRPGAWLNDEVINLYFELLKERERREPKHFLKCHFFNTFFYKKLIGGRDGYDYKSVRRWTTQKKLGYGLIDCDKIFVPIHQEVHWCLAVINKKDKKFQYLDSLGGIDAQVLKVLAKYIVDEVKDKSGQEIDVSSWEREYVEDLPEQHNGFDCGVFMIKYADFYSRGMGLHFSQEHMPYFRLRTAKEILRLRAD